MTIFFIILFFVLLAVAILLGLDNRRLRKSRKKAHDALDEIIIQLFESEQGARELQECYEQDELSHYDAQELLRAKIRGLESVIEDLRAEHDGVCLPDLNRPSS